MKKLMFAFVLFVAPLAASNPLQEIEYREKFKLDLKITMMLLEYIKENPEQLDVILNELKNTIKQVDKEIQALEADHHFVG